MIFDILYVLVMGLIQGLTEWLPVSSSGHLVITQEFFNIQERTLFDAILHLATLLAMTVYFRTDIRPLMNLKNPITHKIILASLPMIIIGFVLKDYIEAAFSFTLLVAVFLVINGCVLMLNLFVKRPEHKNKEAKAAKFKPPRTKNALIIGLFQVFALLPGISRSGTTITTGKILGLDWKRAAKFSFFISFIPIASAAWFKIFTAYHEFEVIYILGFLVAFIVGYSSIDIMMRILQAGRFHYFGIYTIILGIIILVAIY